MKTKHWMTLTVVTVLAGLLAGCADTPSNAAGKAMRGAVAQATSLLTLAQGQIEKQPVALGEKERKELKEKFGLDVKEPKEEFGLNVAATQTLDKAEAILKAALKEYNALKGENPEAVAPVDASLVQRALGGVWALRGQLAYYQMNNEIEKLRYAQSRTLDMLQPVQTSSVQVASMQARLNLTIDAPAKLKADAEAQKATADTTLGTSNTNIKTLKAEIAALETKIRATNVKATRLRSESGMTNTKAAQVALRQAQGLDKESAAFAFAIEKAQFEILKNQAAIQTAELDLTAATKIIAEAVAMTTSRTATVASIKTQIAAGQTVVQKHVTDCAARLGEFDTHLTNIQTLSAKAIAAYQAAADQYSNAEVGVWKTLKPQIISEQGDALALVANLHSEILTVRKQVTLVGQRLTTAWEGLGDDAPAAPASKKATAFMTATATSMTAMVEVYKLAIETLQNAADTSGETRQWAFEANLAEARLDYAEALVLVGNDSEATNQIAEAKQLWSTIQQGAERMKRMASIQALKKRLDQ